MKIYFEKIKRNTGLNFINETTNFDYVNNDLERYIRDKLYFLKTHNKNYNKEQYYTIMELADIFDCIEFD